MIKIIIIITIIIIIHCVREEKIISLKAGGNGNFVSVRLGIIAYFHEFDINLFLLVIFYLFIYFYFHQTCMEQIFNYNF